MSLQKGFFKVQSSNPILPPEEWVLDSEYTSAGAYSTSLSWGKYKIVISGAGGGGAAAGWQSSSGTRYANAGSNGEEKIIYVDVLENNTLTISGIIGAGGTGGKARATHSNTNVGGNGGAGYQNGSNGTNQQYIWSGGDNSASTSGGGGGGSTSLEYDNIIEIAKGGNGGNARHSSYGIWGYGGTGGSGGTTTGTGATGGAGDGAYSTSQRIGGTGATGYVRIYKSNLYPEPL